MGTSFLIQVENLAKIAWQHERRGGERGGRSLNCQQKVVIQLQNHRVNANNKIKYHRKS